MDKTQQLIIDRFDIIDLFNRYAIGADTRNEELYRSCFADELLVDVGGESVEHTAESWIEQAFAALSPFEKTQHIISNHTFDIDGDTAVAGAYLQAHHFTKENTLSVWGHYTHKLTRTPAGWRIHDLTLTTDWHEFK